MDAGRKWIRDPRVVLDLGARDCAESLAFARDYPSAAVFAFECSPTSVTACQKAARDSGRVTVVPMAVHEFSGSADFFPVSPNAPPGFSPNVGASSLFRASGHMVTEPIYQTECKVPCVRLDEWARQASIETFDVVWMDLQGAELLALKGMGEMVSTVRVLHTEVTYRELYRGQVLFPELNAWLNKREFVLAYHERAITVPDWFGEAVYVHKSALNIASDTRL